MTHPATTTPAPAVARLIRSVSAAFTTRTVRQGRQHFDDGHVVIEGGDERTVVCRVSDERPKPYLVVLGFAEANTRARLLVACGCSYFLEGFPCKHIYASLLAADTAALPLAREAAREPRLEVVPDKGLALDDDWFFSGAGSLAGAQAAPREAPGADWEARLKALRRSALPWNTTSPVAAALARPPVHELRFVIEADKSEALQTLCVTWLRPESGGAGEAAARVPLPLTAADAAAVTDPGLRAALEPLVALGLTAAAEPAGVHAAVIPAAFFEGLLRSLSNTGRLELDSAPGVPVTLDLGPPWRPELRVLPASDGEPWRLEGRLVRDGEVVALDEVRAILREGLAILPGRICRLAAQQGVNCVRHLRSSGPLLFPAEQLGAVLQELAESPDLPPLQLPEPWRVVQRAPRPSLFFREPQPRARTIGAALRFDYDLVRFAPGSSGSGVVELATQQLLQRDRLAEAQALAHLAALGAEPPEAPDEGDVAVRRADFPRVVRVLLAAGWQVEASGRTLRSVSRQELRLESGPNWFELGGEVEFAGERLQVPELLRALAIGEGFVRLSDGSDGVLPEDWQERFAALGELGSVAGEKLRFGSHQALFLDVLLDEQLGVATDEHFARVRTRLNAAARVRARREPRSFRGELRAYQREGLGWLRQLERLGLGGVLADDMGLGKTVQVLALLERRRRLLARARAARRPSLVVAPKSLLHNWSTEASRFAPELSVMLYGGMQRGELLSAMAEHDLVITTYGTLRRDIDVLREVDFDYVILDEAQAVKNAGAQSSRAVRLLSARHRLALSGTPIENHLGELWAIFEFLAPRLLGSHRDFLAMTRGGRDGRTGLALLARALRPLILRRTKDQVLTELPEKTELTLYCELEGDQARLYQELRDYYRTTLEARIETEGLERSRMHVLEALLRLRQAACHPGLLDEARRDDDSSKLETLLEHLEEILAEGHKALVFSQFVQLLSLVRARLDRDGRSYAYLDGRTTDREAQVRRFQEDPGTQLFLVSLKAGGLGLNLTAADYVFILDPWWNPAVEAQAIDRAHRIGQTRPVFAYRLIARDTVEEKILELHARKRRLASAIISEDNAALEQLTLDELRMLLG
jgi:superfamily II DNA or RNA helicase